MLSDETYMHRCIELAQLGEGFVAPNPMVGAVIVYQNRIIGEGYHRIYGEAHAEVNAFLDVKKPELLPYSTIYVSLEPCSHHGKTPPCVELIIKHQIRRVVIGCIDPYHEVSGNGIKKLEEAGIEVTIGVLEKECRHLNRRFFTFHQKERPYIVLKWAQSKDGFIDRVRKSGEDPKINWISSPETQTLTHYWRSREQAILVGRKTVENDNPSLTVREIEGKTPLRIVIDSQLKIPESAVIFTDQLETIIFNRIKTEKKAHVHYIKLEAIDTRNIVKALYEMNIQSLFIEGGSRTLQYFLLDHLWDEARVIVGDSFIGEGVKAPAIQSVPRSDESFSKDKIYYYFRK